MALTEHPLFRLVDTPGPDVAHGSCYYSGITGPGVDTGILIEFEGTLFLSINTIREIAEVAGFRLNEEGIELEMQNAEYKRRNGELVDVNGELQAQLDDANRIIGAAVSATPSTPLSAVKPAAKRAPAKTPAKK